MDLLAISFFPLANITYLLSSVKSRFIHKYCPKVKGDREERRGANQREQHRVMGGVSVSQENDMNVGKCHNGTDCSCASIKTISKTKNKNVLGRNPCPFF